MQGLLKRVESIAREEGAKRVVSVQVRLGALSGITPGHLQAHFHEAARGTLAEKAVLEIEQSADIMDPSAQSITVHSLKVEAA